jgi:hypothetical protein
LSEMYKSLDLYVAVHSHSIHDPSVSSIEQSTIVDYAAATTTTEMMMINIVIASR